MYTPFIILLSTAAASAANIPRTDLDPRGGSSVKTYFGGANFPFTLSHDQAPRMDGKDYVDLHNKYRALHHAAPLTHNAKLQTEVNGWVDKCYPGDPHAGSNWYTGTAGAPADALYAWYNERSNFTALTKDYTVDPPGVIKTPAGGSVTPPEVGHFTQMVWNSTTSVACASKKCPSGGFDMVTTICLYEPAGNMVFDGVDLTLREVYRPSG